MKVPLIGWAKAFDYKIIESQPPLVRLLLAVVVRTSDTPFQKQNRIQFRIFYVIFSLGFSEFLIRRQLRQLFPNPQL